MTNPLPRVGSSLAALLLFIPTVWGQVPDMIDLRHPPSGVLTFVPPQNPIHAKYVGDVDGDGLDDFFVAVPDGKSHRDGILLFGGAGFQPGKPLPLLEERHSYFTGGGAFDLDSDEAGAGDVDGDGHGDLLLGLGAVSYDGLAHSGLLVLIFGRGDFPASVDPLDPGASGLRFSRLVSREAELFSGEGAIQAGDLNGDGRADIAIGSRGRGTENGLLGAGSLHVVFGGPHLLGDIELSDVGSNVPGFVIRGATGAPLEPGSGIADTLGTNTAPIGDVNGDGYDDLGAGAWGVQGERGAVYLVLGGPGLDGARELRIAEPGGPLVELLGNPGLYGQFGISVSAAGDVDRDGLGDVLVGASRESAAYLIFGVRDWPASSDVTDPALRLCRLDGRTHLTIFGAMTNEAQLGSVATSAGDWNEDGYADFFVTSTQEFVRFAHNTGEGYLILGGPHLAGTVASVADVGTPALPGLTIQGREANAWFGYAADGKGDLNGDGRPDLLVCSYYRSIGLAPDLPRNQGYVYAFLGGSPVGETLDVQSLAPREGSVDGGEELTLFGAGFRGDEDVRLGGASSPRVTAVTSAELRAVIPAGGGLGPVDVEVRGTRGSVRLEKAFEYTEEPFSRDLVLDPEALRAAGRRVLVFSDSEWAPPGINFGQFMNVYFHDVNADGMDDLFIGEPAGGDEGYGRVSIIFGTSSPPSEIGPAETGAYGTVIEPEGLRWGLGRNLAFPGDADGDGMRDILLGGATDHDELQADLRSKSGAAYLLFGREAWPKSIVLDDALAKGGAVAIVNESCGLSRALGPGDLDGDAIPDLALSYTDVGCKGSDAHARVIFGGAGLRGGDLGPRNVITGDPTPVERYIQSDGTGRIVPRQFGSAVCAGDLNGDGKRDLVVLADHAIGAAYFVLGGSWDFGEAPITDLIAQKRAVFVLHEEHTSGFDYLAGLGDFNGDGLDDVAIGTPYGAGDDHGAVYVIYGSRDFGSMVPEVKILREGPERVLKMYGEFGLDWTGFVDALGDVNGDGLADLGITNAGLRSGSSKAYVVLGARESPAVLDLAYLGRRGFRLICAEGSQLSHSKGGIASGDFDGDGAIDIAVGQGVQGIQKRVLLLFGKKYSSGLFTRGEANGTGTVDLSDAVFVLGYLFLGGRELLCEDAADVDDSGRIELTDAIYLLSHLFLGQRAPPEPFPRPGRDPTEDTLGCAGS